MGVNVIAVLVAAIVSQGIGMFWYSPAGFGKQWMTLLGMDQAKVDAMKASGEMKKVYMIGFVASLVTAYVFAKLLQMMGATTATQGLTLGFWVWLGFVATVQIGVVLWEGKPSKLFYINTGFSLTNLLVIGALLASWG